jgi:hypothetical protein
MHHQIDEFSLRPSLNRRCLNFIGSKSNNLELDWVHILRSTQLSGKGLAPALIWVLPVGGYGGRVSIFSSQVLT